MNSLLLVFSLLATTELVFAEGSKCFQAAKGPQQYQKLRPEVDVFEFKMPGMKVASISDSSLSTGVTLFSFEPGATASFDARGGSVASNETSLLDEGSYSNEIDAVLFAGGSTMGLEAHQGVRREIFKARSADAGNFDFIPGVPGAVVYDYGGRIEDSQKRLIFPTLGMGAAAYNMAEPNRMLVGRVGAGTSTTANKVSQPIWGGQGAAQVELKLGNKKVKVFAAVILNPHGDIYLPNGQRLDYKMPNVETLMDSEGLTGHKKNTTLSIIVTDVALDRNQLRRLSTMVHTSMASSIRPFHSYTDGDINFAVSTNRVSFPTGEMAYEFEEALQSSAAQAMQEAILRGTLTANPELLSKVRKSDAKK